jgi:hypothetical protein
MEKNKSMQHMKSINKAFFQRCIMLLIILQMISGSKKSHAKETGQFKLTVPTQKSE